MIGARIRQDGLMQSVSWDSPSFTVGMVPGMTITQIDGEPFSFDALRRAIQATSPAPIRLTVISEAGGAGELSPDYRAGLRFPYSAGNGY